MRDHPSSVTVARAPFLAAMKRIRSVLPSRTTLPILSHFLLSAERGELTIRASDLDRFASITIPVEGDLSATCIPGDLLADIVEKTPGEFVEIEVARDEVCIRGRGNVATRLATLPADEFPRAPEVDGEPHSVALPASALDLANRFVTYAAAEPVQAKGPAFEGMLCDPLEGAVRFVCTDGVEMAVLDLPVAGRTAAAPAVIPVKAIGAAAALCEGAARMEFAGSYIRFSTDAAELMARLVSSQDYLFPPYRMLMEGDYDYEVVFDVDELSAAAARAKTVYGASPLPLISLSWGHDGGSASARKDRNQMEAPLQFQHVAGPPAEHRFDAALLAKLLGKIGLSKVRMRGRRLSAGSAMTAWRPEPAGATDRTHYLVSMLPEGLTRGTKPR